MIAKPNPPTRTSPATTVRATALAFPNSLLTLPLFSSRPGMWRTDDDDDDDDDSAVSELADQEGLVILPIDSIDLIVFTTDAFQGW